MQGNFRSIYLYPNGEDTQAIKVILENLKDFFSYENLFILDDAKEESSLFAYKDEIAKNGELWIAHQDKKIYCTLMQKARILSKDLVCNGIEKMQLLLHKHLKEMRFEAIIASQKNIMFLNLTSYFVSQFFITLTKDNDLIKILKILSQEISIYFKNLLNIPENSIGIAVTTFSSNRHLGNIGQLLEDMGVYVVYVYYNTESFNEIPPSKGSKAVIIPLQMSYMGKFLNIFKMFITCLMPLAAPNLGCKMVYVSHAYIDPIAALVQRKRPLDNFWFQRKVGIGGYRIIPSLSNYKIYEDAVKALGYEDELVCGGYPSLDFAIKEYEELPLNSGGGGNILIAINALDNIGIIEEFLMQIQNQSAQNFKVIFRPHPGYKTQSAIIGIKEKFMQQDWFIYDDSSRLSAESMRDSCVLIGDYSSLVWTFPLITLKPAILVFKDKAIIKNVYNGVSFFNPLLHFLASDADEIFSCIVESKKHTEQRAQKILEYRKKEVFNLGHSSEFIANFIVKKLKEEGRG
ncbi:CDP-glycerol glycerophosphotransferase family protein [Helicobacter sp.]|uniref:CDP-glycerol glycerophosphotransferase family protein n=1 Tax=Helicobacter sp. TaxID=218 RepID=UPI0025C55029|nr:CDP-glycerol glycerophosphotransferase family protein [Helicobacter sp.]MCI5967958.1 CDP-glycerol glycerophosphotransferase family protein [Helicobacter sp.]MDY2585071.1 CDP-glycerol glycerophosphotransferase family protein [Helicobacter sp.]